LAFSGGALKKLKALFGSLEEMGRKSFGGEQYRGKLRNSSHFLKEYFF